MTEDRRYPLSTYGQEDRSAPFFTGRTADGSQLLLGPFDGGILVIRFSRDGEFLACEQHPLLTSRESIGADIRARHPVLGASDFAMLRAIEFGDAEGAEVRVLRDRLGVSPATIQVRAFHLDDYPIGIDPYPDFLEQVKDDPGSIEDEEEREELLEALRNWEANGEFVFWWGNDLYVDGTGKVVSS